MYATKTDQYENDFILVLIPCTYQSIVNYTEEILSLTYTLLIYTFKFYDFLYSILSLTTRPKKKEGLTQKTVESRGERTQCRGTRGR